MSSLISGEYHSEFGLKIPEWRIMAVLGDAAPLTQRDLVAATLMDKVAVNRACKALEERALVARSPNEACAALLLYGSGQDFPGSHWQAIVVASVLATIILLVYVCNFFRRSRGQRILIRHT